MPQSKETKKLREKMTPLLATVEDEDFAGDEYELVRCCSGTITGLCSLLTERGGVYSCYSRSHLLILENTR